MITHTVELDNLSAMPQIIKTATKGKYTIRTLEPEYLANADLNLRMYRSLITNQTGEIICIAPAQSLPIDNFNQMISVSPSEKNEIRITEIIEGTMINMFWDNDKWEIATKRSVGGNYHFFRNQYFPDLPENEQKTFKQMFMDGLGISGDIQEFANSLNLSKTHCYSFVMQHPANHIVVNVNSPAVYLVSCYDIRNHSFNYVDVFLLRPVFENTNVKFPRFFNDLCGHNATPIDNAFVEDEKIYLVGQETHIIENVKSCMNHPLNSFSIPGAMVTHIPTGFRTSYENVAYTTAKLLRGNNSNLHYQYLVLRKVDKCDLFLQCFPQYRAHFSKFREHFELFATRIHKLYVEVHVTKTITLESVTDKRDKYHIEKLHYEHYIPALKLSKQDSQLPKPRITRKIVVEYLDGENVMVPI